MNRRALVLLAAVLAFGAGAGRAEAPVRVSAAASLTDALSDIASRWRARGHAAPLLMFGGSATLAKQVEAGAPVDLFASADQAWMDYLDAKGLIDGASRVDLLGGELVLIAPRGRGFHVQLDPGFAIASAFAGKLCTGEPDTVPVGRYARQALDSLGWWRPLQGRIVGTDDVRTALRFVERGECAAGIVYATDAVVSDQVEVVARFEPRHHAPIVYPFALTRTARREARDFLAYLRAPEATAIFQRYGFIPLQPAR